MASASETTAPSTQPPLTLPLTSPSMFTAIAAPGARGPEPSMSTTLATATGLPAPRQRSMSSSSSRMCVLRVGRAVTPARGFVADDRRELFHRGQRMPLDEVVDVGQRCGHAPGQRGVARRDLQRVDPHDVEGHSLQAAHLLGEHVGVAAVPAIAEDDDDRAAGHSAYAPFVVEPPQA